MRLGRRPHARRALLVLLLLIVAGWLVPQFFSAERYRPRVQSGLERALGREASFGAISLHLLPRPGFTLENVVIGEDPAFGAEPFARVDRMDCDLRLRGILPWRLDILRLSLDRPSFNLVRNAAGQWNVESLLGRQGAAARQPASVGLSSLQLQANDARINFKLGEDKTPLAVTDVDGRLDFERARHTVKFQLTGSPVRTDLTLPTPGQLNFEGEWTPAAGPAGSLDATLSTQGAMLYDWVPILTSRNPDIYGLVDATAHLTGSLLALSAQGRIRLSQLHRWDQPPPSGTMNSEIYYRGQYDREHGRLVLESVDASFADSHIHLTGSVEDVRTLPVLDLVVAVERSHLEDFRSLAGRFTPRLGDWSASGRLDALMTIQGPWAERRYGGFVDIRNVRLTTPAGAYPLSEINLRIDRSGVRLAPITVDLAPRVELVAEGRIEPDRPVKSLARRRRVAAPAPPGRATYVLTLAARSVPLRDLLRFARGVGVRAAGNVDARGEASAGFTLSGPAWPLGAPSVSGHVDVHAARLIIPGLTEPLNLPKAHIQFRDRTITASPIVAVLGTSVFTGRLEHVGDSTEPWNFDLRANALRLEQGALWFDVLGNRQPLSLLAQLPGLRSLVERRNAASNIFTALKARGRFSTPRLFYRALTLNDFQAGVEIGDRVVRINGATFRAGGGRGTGKLVVDLTQSPVRLIADAGIVDAHLQPLVSFLPAALRNTRGIYSAGGHFVTLGLSRQEITSNLRGQAEVRLKNVSFGAFDPLAAMVRAAQESILEPVRGDAAVHSASLNLLVNDRRVVVSTLAPVAFSGAHLRLEGTYAFDGTANMNLLADLRGLTRQPLHEGESVFGSQQLRLRLAGPLNKLAIAPVEELSRVVRAKP
jgi:AsmA family